MLRLFLPLVLPWIVRWAEREEARVLREGEQLTAEEKRRAVAIGVLDVDRIRVQCVDEIPFPGGPLQGLARFAGFAPHLTSGLCLGYAIFLRRDQWRSAWIVAHECVHTAQVERMGGFRPFLKEYLHQCLRDGYPESALEKEAMLTSADVMEEHP